MGSSGTMATCRGTLKFAMCSRAQATTPSASSEASARGTTKAMPTSPMRSSGTPITAAWATPGISNSRLSISAG